MAKTNAPERLAAELAELHKRAKLTGWDAFVRELQIPGDIVPAIMANRPELIALMPPRALTADETRVVYQLIAGLMETNQALREHTSNVATLVRDWLTAFAGLNTIGRRIDDYASFRLDRDEEEETAA